MKLVKIISMTLAALAATTSATRADDLSELVAAVAGSMIIENINNDTKVVNIGADKPRYQAKAKTLPIDVDFIDGVFKAMKQRRFNEMRLKDGDYPEETYLQPDQYTPTLWRRAFFRPVPGQITSNFGWRQQFHRIHHGVDLSLHVGDTVRAAVAGIIDKITYDHDGYGNYIVISHPDGMETIYGHLQYALVVQNQYVAMGQPIGIGGNTGNSTGPHLHFEARLGGYAVDPTMIFDFYGTERILDEQPRTIKTAPTPTYTHQSKSLAKESTYIVRYGDTLQSVARQAGLSVMRLCQLNMINESDPLQVGRMLKLK